jgi:hypothetical protein
VSTLSATSALVVSLLLAGKVAAAPCPAAGGTVTIQLLPPFGAAPSTVDLTGELVEQSCEDDGTLAVTYDLPVDCAESPCRFTAQGLAPGLWVHRISVGGGESAGQRQARRGLVLDASAGAQTVLWNLFRTVATVVDMGDSLECEGCLRRALELSGEADKPMLIAFDTPLAGDVVLSDQLPELGASQVTLDALDFDGLPHRRGIDVNGLPRAALRITGGSNRVIGLRLANAGGDADVLLIDGTAANGNRVESTQIVGRTLEVCEDRGQIGCVIDGQCSVPTRFAANGDCGDDGIAVRDDAGRLGANHFVDVDVTGAYDKGVKISDGAVAVLERSRVHGNSDGGIQTTLGGTLTALENVSEANRGTRGANGLAANGPRLDGSDPASLTTRGNLLRHNALRGLSVRSLSHAVLRDDFVCGNGTEGTEAGFGLALLDAAGFSASASVRGIALVHNLAGGLSTMETSTADLGTADSPGRNALAFNGIGSNLSGPKQLRNQTALPLTAVGNHWESCGPTYDCAEIAVLIGSVYSPDATVDVAPARPNAQREAPIIHEIRPTFARAGELVWIYGEGFDAVGGAAQDAECDGAGRPCRASDPNCVFIDRQGAEIVAATPTLLVIRAPFTCVEPVKLIARTRHSRGYARTRWCTIED